MSIRKLVRDDDAVSPVIGVILMVAITVILAAVIGAFVLGLGDSMQTTSPQASFNWDQSGDGGANDLELEVSHSSGDPIDEGELEVVIDGNNIEESVDVSNTGWASNGEVSAGDTLTITYDDGGTGTVHVGDHDTTESSNIESGDVIRIVWTSPDGGDSAVLTDYTVN